MARAFDIFGVKVQHRGFVLLRTFRNEKEGVLFLCHTLQLSSLLSPFLIRFLFFLLFFSLLFFSFHSISCPVRSRGILYEDNGNYAS